jgi:hypothetical protein
MQRRAVTWRTLLTSVALVCVPVAAWSLYLMVSRTAPQHWTFFSDDVFLGLSVLAGASFILALPMRGSWKVALAIAYIPIASGFLFVYALAFVCGVFHKCM